MALSQHHKSKNKVKILVVTGLIIAGLITFFAMYWMEHHDRDDDYYKQEHNIEMGIRGPDNMC